MKNSVGVAVAAAVMLAGCGGSSAGSSSASTAAIPSKSASAAPSTPAASANPRATYGNSFNGTPGQFTVGVTILRKKCFGSAGCNVTYRIEPSYVGQERIPKSGTVEVTYKVTGGESEAINTFTIVGDQMRFPAEEDAHTPNEEAQLVAEATAVSYRP